MWPRRLTIGREFRDVSGPFILCADMRMENKFSSVPRSQSSFLIFYTYIKRLAVLFKCLTNLIENSIPKGYLKVSYSMLINLPVL